MRSDLAAATVAHTGKKMTQAEAGYKRGTKAEHCGICEHYEHPHACEVVIGKIFPAMWCWYFGKAK
jgi:hypothetical protein